MDDDKEKMSDDEAAMMAEWTAMAENSGADRTLDQSEIDDIFSTDDGKSGPTGIEALMNSGMVAYERFPMLDVIFERLIRLMSTSLRNFMAQNVEISLKKTVSMRFGEYLNGVPLPAMINIFKIPEWDGGGLLTVETPLMYSMIDILLGGKRAGELGRIDGRPYTNIELSLINRFVEVVLQDLTTAFQPVGPVNFVFDRQETVPRFATIVRPNNAVILTVLHLSIDGLGGDLECVLPYSSLEPVRPTLLQMFVGDKFGLDTIWEGHLKKALWKTALPMEAILGQMTVNLKDVLAWEVGSQIIFHNHPKDPINVTSSNRKLFIGHIGQRNGHVAFQVEESFMKRPPQKNKA